MKESIVQLGDKVLRQKAKPVAKKDIGSKELTKLINMMKRLLAKEEYGVAIAAPQVGESLRLFVVAGRAFLPPKEEGDDEQTPPPDRVFINPQIVRLSKKQAEMSEGCLSVRGKYGVVMRHEKATIKALNEKSEAVTYHGTGLVGHIFQHECDHLEGVLFIDKLEREIKDDE
jgi:peptide deformylase